MFYIYYRLHNEEQFIKVKYSMATIDDAMKLCALHLKLLYYELGVTSMTYQIYQNSIFMKEITLNKID